MSTFVQLLYGPMLLGVMLNILLYGIMVTQTYLYFSMYKDDRLRLKVFVLVLFALDTLNTALDIATVYVPLINQFGDPEALSRSTWMFASDSAMTATIAVLVQFFFAWRLKVLTSNIWLKLAIHTDPTVYGIGVGIRRIFAVKPSFGEVRRFRAVGIIWSVTMAFTDVLIAAALVRYLWKHKTGVATTDNMINKIIRLTVQTGFITALFAVMTVILYLTLSSGYDLVFHFPLAKLYTNSLMSTLNSRKMWMAEFCASDSMDNMSFGPSVNTGGAPERTNLSLRPRGARGANLNVVNVDVDVARTGTGTDRRGRTRGPERIVIGVEAHQMTDLGSSDGKDGDEHSTRSFVPAEKTRGMSAAEAAV
ncbi:hypothetical protein V8D89_009351 [Ganoderma adspersum]